MGVEATGIDLGETGNRSGLEFVRQHPPGIWLVHHELLILKRYKTVKLICLSNGMGVARECRGRVGESGYTVRQLIAPPAYDE